MLESRPKISSLAHLSRKMKMARLTKFLLVALLVCMALLASEPKQPMLGQNAPGFVLQSLDGKRVGLDDFKGKHVVLHFGTGWGPFCNAEAPHLEALWQKYKTRGVQVLVIDVKETREETAKYSERSKFSFPVLMDSDGKAATLYAPPDALPDLARDQVPIASNLIIDPQGKIQFYTLLDSANFDARLVRLTSALDKLLNGKLGNSSWDLSCPPPYLVVRQNSSRLRNSIVPASSPRV